MTKNTNVSLRKMRTNTWRNGQRRNTIFKTKNQKVSKQGLTIPNSWLAGKWVYLLEIGKIQWVVFFWSFSIISDWWYKIYCLLNQQPCHWKDKESLIFVNLWGQAAHKNKLCSLSWKLHSYKVLVPENVWAFISNE